MANVGLTDNALAPLLDILQDNTTLVALNLETNYLSGEFLTSLFKAMLKNQTIEEIRASNQVQSIATAVPAWPWRYRHPIVFLIEIFQFYKGRN